MNALVEFPGNGLEYRQSTDAAGLCGAIVQQTAKSIQGRKYVTVEGWQAIAIAHGCAASARAVERVDGGVRAIGEIRRMHDGAVIAEAEGFVGEDEPTWFGGNMRKWKWGERRGEKVWYDEHMPKRADYAIRAMAQTRAISRACRSAFAHVVVMIDAGLSTTPAEEVPDGGFVDAQYEDVHEKPREERGAGNAHRQQDAPAPSINDGQWAAITDLLEKTNSDVRAFCDHYKIQSVKHLPISSFGRARDQLEKKLRNMAEAQRQNGDAFGIDDEVKFP